MKKLIFALIPLAMLGCKFDTGSGIGKTSSVAPQGNDEKRSTETVADYATEDVSDNEYGFSTRKDLSMDGEYIEIVQTEDKSGTVLNWVLSHDYKTMSCTGFECDLKINGNMNYAAIRLNKKGSYDDILFEVRSDGHFRIEQTGKGSLLNLAPAESRLDMAKFNRIKARTCDSGRVEVYVNGYMAAKFEKEDLAFQLTDTDKFGLAYNVKSTTSKKEPAIAWIKTIAIQNVKK